MRLIKFFGLALLCVFVSGCKEPFLSLSFEESIKDKRYLSNRAKPLPIYAEMIERAAHAAGIEPNELELVYPEQENNRIYVHLNPSAHSEGQLAEFRQYFEAIVEARKAATLSGQVLVKKGEHSSAAQVPQPHFNDTTFRVGIESKMEVEIRESLIETVLGPAQRSSEGSCRLVYPLEHGLPFKLAHDRQDSKQVYLGENMYGSIRNIPASVQFADQDLSQLLERKKMQVKLRPSRFGRGEVNELTFAFGSLGAIRHENVKIGSFRMIELQLQCVEQAVALGRPFSFYMGDGLDRLVSVYAY